MRTFVPTWQTAAVVALTASLSACGGANGGGDAGAAPKASVLQGLGYGNTAREEQPAPNEVQKAQCGNGDSPETGLQGQVPAALRAAGFKGFSCNLELLAQSRNDGGSWQHAFHEDQAGHRCSFYDTSSATANRTHQGVAVIDTTDLTKAVPTAFLTTIGMLDPWESLKVNTGRQVVGAVNARNGNGGPELDLYDVSSDCRLPQLLSSLPVGKDDGTGQFVAPVRGHEGNFSPDGLTYYATNLGAGYIYPIDITNMSRPRMLTQYFTAPGRIHGLSVSEDGNRAYLALLGQGGAQRAAGTPPNNGLQIVDVSEVQARVPNPQIKVVGQVMWDDGGGAQHTIDVRIKGKPYVIHVDEAGSGGNSATGWRAACSAGLPAWQFARIIDISNESKPEVVSKLMLEAYDPKNCQQVLPDLAGLGSFTYGAHYCSVDNRKNATTLACGYFNSGIRVFDIRNPVRVKEIAYFNPAGTITQSPGSNHNRGGGWVSGGADWCTAQIQLDAKTGTLKTMCQDNGFMTLRFRNGVWPFPGSVTPPGMQN